MVQSHLFFGLKHGAVVQWEEPSRVQFATALLTCYKRPRATLCGLKEWGLVLCLLERFTTFLFAKNTHNNCEEDFCTFIIIIIIHILKASIDVFMMSTYKAKNL